MDKEKAAWFINEQQMSFSKWIISLSIAIISFTFLFLFNHPSNLKFQWVITSGLVLLILTIIAGILYVYVVLAGLGYHLSADISQGNVREKNIQLAQRYECFMKYLYPAFSATFLLGLILVSIFVIINLTQTKP